GDGIGRHLLKQCSGLYAQHPRQPLQLRGIWDNQPPLDLAQLRRLNPCLIANHLQTQPPLQSLTPEPRHTLPPVWFTLAQRLVIMPPSVAPASPANRGARGG